MAVLNKWKYLYSAHITYCLVVLCTVFPLYRAFFDSQNKVSKAWGIKRVEEFKGSGGCWQVRRNEAPFPIPVIPRVLPIFQFPPLSLTFSRFLPISQLKEPLWRRELQSYEHEIVWSFGVAVYTKNKSDTQNNLLGLLSFSHFQILNSWQSLLQLPVIIQPSHLLCTHPLLGCQLSEPPPPPQSKKKCQDIKYSIKLTFD